MTEHTPGPWTIEEYGDDDAPALVIHKDSETRVCFMATAGSHGDPARIEADARLIAAAPSLLATAQEVDRLMLVIESAVRSAHAVEYDAILTALRANRDAVGMAVSATKGDA